MRTFLVICAFGISFGSFSQKELQEVTINDSIQLKKDKLNSINRERIVQLQAEDVGQVLQKFAGVNIKSYGGLGGMKTISVRSLGSQHTSLVIDGFSISNAQTGQVNLANVQVDNIENIQLITGASKQYFTPVSALISGSCLQIETFEGSFSSEIFKLRASTKIGSFKQFDQYLSSKYSTSNFFVSAFGKLRFSDGSYPYSFQNGKFTYNGIRLNNQYQDVYGGINSGVRLKKGGLIQIGFRADMATQELPGAVVLYSDLAAQNLDTDQQRAQVSYSKYFERFSFRVYSAFSRNNLHYTDTTVLNSYGGIFSFYRNDQLQNGFNVKYDFRQYGKLFLGSEHHFNELLSSLSGLDHVQRNHNFSIMGYQYSSRIFQLLGQVSSQIVQDRTNLDSIYTFRKFNPLAQIDFKEIGKYSKLIFSAFYKNSFRMPSFNELYYNSIGNTKLKPEEANQFSGGLTFVSKPSKLNLEARSNFYFNKVKNKIVAVPTKNLFIWSMQNVGDVNITGVELLADLKWKANEKLSFIMNTNYTFQQTIDLSDEDSPTYRNQIAYVPRHTANADLSIKWKETGLRYSSFWNSLRYSLNENIPANEVDGFVVSDLSVFHTFKPKKNSFRIQLTCKNVFNVSYTIVRYYVMPGRNFLITFNYAYN